MPPSSPEAATSQALWRPIWRALLVLAVGLPWCLWALWDVAHPRVDLAYRAFYITRDADCPDASALSVAVDRLPWQLDFGLLQPASGAECYVGWNAAEPGRIWSSRPDARLTLRLAPGLVPHAVTAMLAPPDGIDRPEAVGLAADGTVLARETIDRRGVVPLHAGLPAATSSGASGKPLVLTFHVDRAAAPIEATGVTGDRRRLGLALLSLALQ